MIVSLIYFICSFPCYDSLGSLCSFVVIEVEGREQRSIAGVTRSIIVRKY
jgi:hypothetical protein